MPQGADGPEPRRSSLADLGMALMTVADDGDAERLPFSYDLVSKFVSETGP